MMDVIVLLGAAVAIGVGYGAYENWRWHKEQKRLMRRDRDQIKPW